MFHLEPTRKNISDMYFRSEVEIEIRLNNKMALFKSDLDFEDFMKKIEHRQAVYKHIQSESCTEKGTVSVC